MKVKKSFSRISEKGQITIPKNIRESLRAHPGDLLEYEVQGNTVLVKKVEAFDAAFHTALADTVNEWNSSEDDQAFRDL